MIAVIDSPVSNIFSFTSALERLNLPFHLVREPKNILSDDKYLVLPGVGHASFMMTFLRDYKWDTYIREGHLPFLGICLGFQVLFEHLDEGDCEGLGIFKGRVVRLPFKTNPNMGWCREVGRSEYFYYVHSYGVLDSPSAVSWLNSSPPAISRANKGKFSGVQFHPERSGDKGELFLRGYFNESYSIY